MLILALLAAVLPWLLNRSLRFRLHNSSYRGLRFRFLGATRTAYWVFLALPVLTVLTLFGASPFWHHRLKQYQHGNAAYGRSHFRYGASLYDFYRTYFGAAGLFVVVVFVVGVTAS